MKREIIIKVISDVFDNFLSLVHEVLQIFQLKIQFDAIY